MRLAFRRVPVLWLLVLSLGVSPLSAQSTTGTIQGVITDNQDAVVPAAAETVDSLADGLEARLQARIDEARRLGELDRAGASVEQLEAQQVLQSADLVAERGRRDVQLLGGLGEAQMPSRGLEGPQRIQGRQGAHLGDTFRFSHVRSEISSFVARTLSAYPFTQNPRVCEE